jgi:hypothetical protein
MRTGRHFISSIVLLPALLAGGSLASAQSGRSWVDPPADLATPSKPSPSKPSPLKPSPSAGAVSSETPQQAPRPSQPSPSIQSAQPEAAPSAPPSQSGVIARPQDTGENLLTARAEEAKDFVTTYLASWSAPNDETLEATTDFYAPQILFHGRPMKLAQLVKEKRRFVKRWPERQYRPRSDALKVTCEPLGRFCTVHTLFDFMAANPRRGRRTEGVGALQLVVSFADRQPLITAENSKVLDQDHHRRNIAQEGSSDD